MLTLLTLPFRLVFGSLHFGWRAGRLVGPSRALFFGLGVATGVLAASPAARRAALDGVTRLTVAVTEARQDRAPEGEVLQGPASEVVVTTGQTGEVDPGETS